MTSHAPKTAALEALVAGLLSAAGERRIHAHLEACERCRTELATIRAYHELSATIHASYPETELVPRDWSRIEASLGDEARRLSSATLTARRTQAANDASYRGLMLGALGLAAVGLLAIAMSPGAAPAPSITPVTETATVANLPSRVATLGVVSLVAGPATFTTSTARVPLEIDQRLVDGEIHTGADATVQLGLAHDGERGAFARVALSANTDWVLGDAQSDGEADTDTVTTRLTRGRVTLEVFESSARVVVLAGDDRVEVRAARCTIELVHGVVRVSADALSVAGPTTRGEIVVVQGTARSSLPEQGGWSSAADDSAALPTLSPVDLAPLEGAMLSVGSHGGVRFEVGEQRFEGGPTLAMRAPPGPLDLRVFDAAGQERRASIVLGAEGLALRPDELLPVEPARVEATRPRVQGSLPPEAVAPVVRASQRALQRCYEGALRLHPHLGSGVLHARVTLDARGEVHHLALEGESVPPTLEACVRQEAARWQFPSPGGPVTFAVPLHFQARQ